MLRDGSLQDRTTAGLRKAGNADGELRILQPVTLSSFLDTPAARAALGSRPRRR